MDVYIYIYILPLLALYRGYNSLEMAKQQPICTAAVFFSSCQGRVSVGRWLVF